MELNVLKDEKEKLVVDVSNKYSTLAAAIKSELWSDSKTKIASFNKKHSLVGDSELVIEGQNPKTLVKDAVGRIRKNLDKFKKDFLKQI